MFRSGRTIAIEPGGPDRGQPTHFMPGRGWGLFAIQVPADFGENKLTWTIVGQRQDHRDPRQSEARLGDFAVRRSGRG